MRRKVFMLIAALALAACAQADPVLDGPPEGLQVLPDLVPAPPTDLHTSLEDDGWTIGFTSTLVNVGEGDFILDGTRTADGEWSVEQLVPYSESGTSSAPVDIPMVWGGDGHEHWHVGRVAVYWLEALDADGEPVEGADRRFDTKVGFCFFDSHHDLDFGRSEGGYDSSGCGAEEDDSFRMGLSVGWSDVYEWTLPGQFVSIEGLPDGMYRLWGEADPEGWFVESTRDNNLSWVDVEIFEVEGRRAAKPIAVGPEPQASS